jgi:GH15 family glucan-1,4-alpha-glucosidase
MYLPSTNILITRFLTGDGVGEITDSMPIKHTGSAPSQHHLVRAVHVVNGSLSFEIECRPAFNYARDMHTVHLSRDGVVFDSDNLALVLSSSVPLEEDGQGGAHARFTLHEGQWVYFFLESASDHAIVPLSPHRENIRTVLSRPSANGTAGSRSAVTRAAGGKWYSDQRSSSNC